MGLFIDNTGSVVKDEVDDAADEFMDWVRQTIPPSLFPTEVMVLPGRTVFTLHQVRGGYNKLAIAVEDLLDNDSDFIDAVGERIS